MTFKESKSVIRAALANASDAKLIEVLEAARAGEMPYCSQGYCFAARVIGWGVSEAATASVAYRLLVKRVYPPSVLEYDEIRQRIVVAMVLAEMRRRAQRTLDEAETVTVAALFAGVR
jgi:hypothetical protein